MKKLIITIGIILYLTSFSYAVNDTIIICDKIQVSDTIVKHKQNKVLTKENFNTFIDIISYPILCIVLHRIPLPYRQ